LFPQKLAASVIEKKEQQALTEIAVREAIRAGVDPVYAYLKYGQF
jgi:hypothetical protein